MSDHTITYSKFVRESFISALGTSTASCNPNETRNYTTPLSLPSSSSSSTSTSTSSPSSSSVSSKQRLQNCQFYTKLTPISIPALTAISTTPPQTPSTPPSLSALFPNDSHSHSHSHSCSHSHSHSQSQSQALAQSLAQQPETKHKTFFHLLPFEVNEKILRYVAPRRPHALVDLLDGTTGVRDVLFTNNVMELMNHSLTIDEQTIVNLKQWVNICNGDQHAYVKRLDISMSILKHSKVYIWPLLKEIIIRNQHTLTSITMPVMPQLFDMIHNLNMKLDCLRLYIHSKSDMDLLFHRLHIFREDFQQVSTLHLYCVQNEQQRNQQQYQHACFLDNYCILELLSNYLDNSSNHNIFQLAFPNVVDLHLSCYHKLPSHLWNIIHSFDNLQSLNVLDCIVPIMPNNNDGIDINNVNNNENGRAYDNPKDLMKLCSLTDLHIQCSLSKAISIGSSVKTLIATNDLYTVTQINQLSIQCPSLEELTISFDSSSHAHEQVMLPEQLKKLTVYTDYKDVDICINEMYSAFISEYNEVNVSTFLNASTCESLKQLNVYYAKLNLDDLTTTLAQYGQRLHGFGMSLKHQRLASATSMLLYVCNGLAMKYMNKERLTELTFKDLDHQYVDANHEMDVGENEKGKGKGKGKEVYEMLWRMKRAMKMLNTESIEHVVGQVVFKSGYRNQYEYDFDYEYEVEQQVEVENEYGYDNGYDYGIRELLPSIEHNWG